MKSKVVEDADVVTYVVVCDPGDEAVAALSQFAPRSVLKLPRSLPSVGSSEPLWAGSTAPPGTTGASRLMSSASCCPWSVTLLRVRTGRFSTCTWYSASQTERRVGATSSRGACSRRSKRL